MEMASFSGFLRTLGIIVLVYYLFKFAVRIFAPVLMRKAVNKMKEKMENQYNQQQAQQTNTGSSNKQMPKEKKKVGEYIDYEEVK
ncbi:DUF4834 domain-containing protein [Flavobacterium ardleyense]|uniref:DUF4834 domain-containing protein n=1 Tax=Flavobacterium ardleyense TaxID=2038737 RepID=A0ABW5Z9P5_9FLAO